MVLGQILHFLYQIGTAFPTTSFFLSLLGFGWLGDTIMTQYLMQKQVRHTLSRIVFLLTFSCSLSLLSLYLFSILQFSISQYYWYISIIVMVLMCLLIIPLCLIFRIRYSTRIFQIYGFNIPLFGIIMSLLYITLLYILISDMSIQKNIPLNQLRLYVQLIIHYGVYLMALMSAYGAIWCPYVYYNLLNQQQRSKIANAKIKTQDEIHFIIEQTKIHKYELLKLQESIEKVKSQMAGESNKESHLYKIVKVITFGSVRGRAEQLKMLEQKKLQHIRQLQTLKKVHEDSFIYYRDILEQERRHLVSQTFYGKLFRKFSFILATYSVTRIILTIINTILRRTSSTDPITRTILLIQQLASKQISQVVKQVSQYISFIFMGYLMITSVRSFSMNFKNFLDYILRRRRLNILDSATQIYFFSLIYGVYFLAAAILMQFSLPRTYCSNFQIITGKMNLYDHFIRFNWIFMGMCLFSICLILFTQSRRRGKLDVIIRERNLIDTK